MKTKITHKKTLGPVSSRFIKKLLVDGKSIFTLDEATKVYRGTRHETGKFLSDLIKRDVLARIKSGVYLILQMGQEDIQLGNWPVIAGELTGLNEYFISYYSAMRLHGMTTHPSMDVYITMSKRCLVKKINNITYHFIYSKPENFWGGCVRWVTKQNKINVSDLERTILDGLERPELCGGIKEVVRGIWAKNKEINWKKMEEYNIRFHTKAAIKRLGFILEMLGLEVKSITDTIASSRNYILLDPYGPNEGKHLSRWHIRLNMNIEELKASVWE